MAGSKEAQQMKVKQCHGENNAVAWQEYQSAHELRVKRDRGQIERSKGSHPSNTQPKEETRCEE